MYKHVSKQRKLADKNKQVVLSDESDDSDDEQLENSSSEAKSGSGSGEAEESEKAEEEEKQEEEEEKEEEVLNPPPTGYPTVTEALKDPIVYPVEAGGDGSEPEVVCVVCPDKALKKGKMLEVHVASNGHKRRFKRFTHHCTTSAFPTSSLTADARTIAAQIDTKVNSTISTEAQFGASASVTPAQLNLERKAAVEGVDSAKLKAAMERRSIRAVLKDQKIGRNVARKVRKEEKKARIEGQKASGVTVAQKIMGENGGPSEGELVSKEQTKKILKVGAEEVRKESSRLGKSLKKQLPKPTPEEIAIRQAAKLAKRAEAATASPASTSGSPPKPKTPTTATGLPKKEPTTTKRKTRGNKATSN